MVAMAPHAEQLHVDASHRRRPKCPNDVYHAKIEKAHSRERDRLDRKRRLARQKLEARECSWPWAFAIWYGHDYCYCTGKLAGSGSEKVECRRCLRWTPPNNVGELAERAAGHRVVTCGVCDDCREWSRVQGRGSADPDWSVPEDAPRIYVQPGAPAVPFSAALDAMESRGERLAKRPLPAASESVLAEAAERYQHRMEVAPSRQKEWLAEWKKSTGTAGQRARYRKSEDCHASTENRRF